MSQATLQMNSVCISISISLPWGALSKEQPTTNLPEAQPGEQLAKVIMATRAQAELPWHQGSLLLAYV